MRKIKILNFIAGILAIVALILVLGTIQGQIDHGLNIFKIETINNVLLLVFSIFSLIFGFMISTSIFFIYLIDSKSSTLVFRIICTMIFIVSAILFYSVGGFSVTVINKPILGFSIIVFSGLAILVRVLLELISIGIKIGEKIKKRGREYPSDSKYLILFFFKKNTMKTKIFLFLILSFSIKVSAQNENSSNNKAIQKVFVGIGLQQNFLLSDQGNGTNPTLVFGANWGKKISGGFQFKVSRNNFMTHKKDFLLYNKLTAMSMGPTLIYSFKKIQLSTNIYCGWLDGEIKLNIAEKGKFVRSVGLFNAGVSEEISYDFASFYGNYNKMSTSIFLIAGLEGCRDDILLVRKGDIAYSCIITFGIRIIFVD